MTKRKTRKTIIGTIRMHPRGFGFVIPKNPSECEQDVFIPKHRTLNAADGDEVEVALESESRKPEKGPEGEILSISKRARSEVGGIISSIEKDQIFAHIPVLNSTKPALVKASKKEKLKVGDRVTLTVTDWGDRKSPLVGEVTQKLGNIEDPTIDIDAAIQDFKILRNFPKEVVEEAKKFGEEVTKTDTKSRLDLTKTSCITIDPDTAKDFDDALSISRDRKGNFYLGVHIADVAHYVRPGSALDTEAKQRCNSTYFPGTCIPMLPEELSNNLCSLKQDVLRLTVSVLMEFDPKGNLLSHKVERAFIKSEKRLTYQEAKDILEGKMKSPHAKAIKDMEALCHLLKQKRNERGSIDFALPELIILLDKKGAPTGVKIEQYHITHQIVEEFMLKANEVVATHIDKKGKQQLFRIHEEPESKNLQDFFALARTFGFNLSPEPTTEEIQKLFKEAKNTTFGQQLAIAFIRTLKIASYSPENVGHYGLALEYYCHFTSPIRRYSDLVTQRILFNEEPKDVDLKKVGEACSDQERVSFKAETSVRLTKKYRLLKKWVEEDPDRKYIGHITKIKPMGFFFEIKDLFLEGFIHVSQLENDYFLYVEKIPMLEGESTKMRYTVGQEVTVYPEEIDLIHQETKWRIEAKRKRKKKS